MKKITKTTVTAIFIIICACLFGSMKASAAEPAPEPGTNIDMEQVIGYAANDGCLQLYFNDGTGYYLEMDIDIARNNTPDVYMYPDGSIVDMNTVIGFSATEYGLQLYLEDGTGYYLER